MNLYIRADADSKIGTGHIMRCIALGQAWQDRGGKVAFLSHCESEVLHHRILDEGFEFVPIDKPHPDPQDLKQVFKQLETRNSELETWLVLDGYHFTQDYQKAIRNGKVHLLVIDDTNHLSHYHADILLNQNIHATKLAYHCGEDTTLLLGTRYLLLRREFLKYKDWKRGMSDRAKKIMVTFGGSDPDNVTLKVIKALNSLGDPTLEVKIVAGPANTNISSLEKEIHHSPFAIHLLSSPSNMPELMTWADIAISAGGSTCWELAFMGLPNIITVIADNQRGIAEELGNEGAVINCGWHEDITLKQYVQTLKEIVQDKGKRSSLAEQGKKLVDGNGARRIIRAMFVGQIKLRMAQGNDCELLWKWANDPNVRQSAFNSKNIAWEDHQVWFLNKQNETGCIQYIALSEQDVPMGQIRFDIKDSIADIDYSVDKDFRGMGLGQMLLKKGIELFCTQQEHPITIQGRVKKGNIPSNRTFQECGFLEVREDNFAENEATKTRTHIIYQMKG